MRPIPDRAEQPSAPGKLRWCVGKFVYARGASQPMHFMELKRFIVDEAVDFSHLFYLRGLRVQLPADSQLDEALKKWMDGTAVQLLAEVILHALQASGLRARVREFYPGIGLTCEYVKLLLERRQRESATTPMGGLLTYEGCGPRGERNKFQVLHADDLAQISYVDEQSAGELFGGEDAVSVLNHNQTVRYDQEPLIGLEQFMNAARAPAVLSVRCTGAAVGQERMTVKGRLVRLPSVSEVLTFCRDKPTRWYHRFWEGFDAGFLLPDGGAPTGLLIAYSAGVDAPRSGFQPVT